MPPNIEIDFFIPYLVWKTLDFDIEACAREAISQTIKMADIPEQIAGKELETSVVLTNDEMIARLNNKYKNKKGPTNVLSFATLDSDAPIIDALPYTLGDIVLSLETLNKEHKEQKKKFSSHYTHLVIHGMLHLLGYNHEEDEEAKIMENLEADILETLGIENPYKEG